MLLTRALAREMNDFVDYTDDNLVSSKLEHVRPMFIYVN